jgi:nitrogen regulatory protein PII
MQTKNHTTTPIQSEIRKISPSIKLLQEFEEFIIFCATPRVLREIKTQREFAKKFGVNEDTLTDWKKVPGFLERVRRVILEREQEELPNVIDALREKAETGDPGAVKLWLQYVGELQLKKLNNKD